MCRCACRAREVAPVQPRHATQLPHLCGADSKYNVSSLNSYSFFLQTGTHVQGRARLREPAAAAASPRPPCRPPCPPTSPHPLTWRARRCCSCCWPWPPPFCPRLQGRHEGGGMRTPGWRTVARAARLCERGTAAAPHRTASRPWRVSAQPAARQNHHSPRLVHGREGRVGWGGRGVGVGGKRRRAHPHRTAARRIAAPRSASTSQATVPCHSPVALTRSLAARRAGAPAAKGRDGAATRGAPPWHRRVWAWCIGPWGLVGGREGVACGWKRTDAERGATLARRRASMRALNPSPQCCRHAPRWWLWLLLAAGVRAGGWVPAPPLRLAHGLPALSAQTAGSRAPRAPPPRGSTAAAPARQMQRAARPSI